MLVLTFARRVLIWATISIAIFAGMLRHSRGWKGHYLFATANVQENVN